MLWGKLGYELRNSYKLQRLTRRRWLLNWFIGKARPLLAKLLAHDASRDDTLDPRLTITNICEFLGLTFTKELLEVDLSRPHSGRWRSEFNAHEQQTINALVKEKLLLLGYPSENESVEN